MRKVLIANRGEIAIRVARAARDHGLASVAVYAEPDIDSLHVKAADEAIALGGTTAADSYLVFDKIIGAAKKSGADAIHPGYGFLSENAEFAQAVIDAGITWIGPPPAAIRSLGDKVAARHIAQRAGAPLVAGTKDPVSGADEVVAFAKENGLPIAIKAAFGGGGRGLKVARDLEEVAELYDSAVREAIAAFGRGECFVERYLDKPRHVETQVLADSHGNVSVISTRDCSLQRRHQKLVEEAPAPFLSESQIAELYRASKAIMKEAAYVGAGTCEFLVGQDGTISFLEVNTRLQVEHPVSEEVTGIDLVREQFRIADGEKLTIIDPVLRGHSIAPSGPGVRLDSGFGAGDVVGGNFDSLLAKLIVTGATRKEALERSRRALDDFIVEGMPTALTFHRAVVRDADFCDEPFRVHTRWIETEFKNEIPPYGSAETGEAGSRETISVEVDGRRFDVTLPAGIGGGGSSTATSARRSGTRKTTAAATGASLVAPMQGTVVKVAASEGDTVSEGDLIIVVEAMKMEQPLNAHKSGTIAGLTVTQGETVTAGTVVCEIN